MTFLNVYGLFEYFFNVFHFQPISTKLFMSVYRKKQIDDMACHKEVDSDIGHSITVCQSKYTSIHMHKLGTIKQKRFRL